MPDSTDRPQDVGRRHRRKGNPSTATRALLEQYQEAMRSELREVLGELRPAVDDQLTLDGKPAAPKRPGLNVRMDLWTLAMKLGRELGGEIDPGPPPADATGRPAPRRRGRVDYGGR